MPSSTIILQLIPSGDVFAARRHNGQLTELSTALHERDIRNVLTGDWDADSDANEDIQRLNADPALWQDITNRYQ